MALDEQLVVPLAGFSPTFDRAATPMMQLVRFVAQVLELPPVPGRELERVRVHVTVCPVELHQLTLHAEDYRHLAALTRAFSVSACQGDQAAEARLWSLRRITDGPFVSRLVPRGVVFFSP